MESIKILLNKAFIFTTLGLTAKTLFGAGMGAFLVKILIVKFGVNAYKASMLIGVMLMFGMISKYFIYTATCNLNINTKTNAEQQQWNTLFIPRYTESVKFRFQSRETASKRKPCRGLGTR